MSKRVTIESGQDARLHSADYADVLKIYVNDECVYESDGIQSDKLPPQYETPAMKKMLTEHIASLHITSDNIGAVRADLLMPFSCEWNGWVRDLTAERENKGGLGAVGETASGEEKGANKQLSD